MLAFHRPPIMRALLLGGVAFTSLPGYGAAPQNATPALSADEAKAIARDAYIYGYSLITTEVTRVQMTNVSKPEGLHAPMGAFMNVQRYPPADFRGISAPNADTLYSIAWVDLTDPQVFSTPDMGKRYYLLPIYSLWMPVIASPGSRTEGQGASKYLLTAPGWQGTVPDGMKQIKSPSRYAVILGRIYADGSDADYKAVNRIQSELKIQPMSTYGKPYTYVAPPVGVVLNNLRCEEITYCLQ